MLSESARATRASESRFRIDAPNARPRAIKVIALDVPSEGVLRRLAEGAWENATFLRTPAGAAPAQPVGGPDTTLLIRRGQSTGDKPLSAKRGATDMAS